MSQSPTPTAFSQAPINPYTAKVQAARAALAVETPATPTPPPTAPAYTPPVATPAPAPVASVTPSAPSYTPPPAPVTSTPPVTPAAPPAAAPIYTPPAIDPVLVERMALERQQLLEQNAAQGEAIKNLLTKQQEAEARLQEQQLREALDNPELYAGLQSIDEEDAKRIASVALNTMKSTLQPVETRTTEQVRALEARLDAISQHQQQERIQSLASRVLSEHPDYYELLKTPEYRNFMSQRDGLSVKTRDERAKEEFLAGNVDYVNGMLRELKGTLPSPTQIATVAPVQTASSGAPAPSDTPAQPPMTLRELNRLYQMRQIELEEYQKMLGELKAANQL